MLKLKWVYYLFTCFIAAIALLLIVSIIPIPGNYKVLIVLSGSMEPEIKVGSVVAVKPSNDYKVGDIITFLSSEKIEAPTTHRIVNIEDADERILYEVKGDANKDSDQSKVLKENVVGKVLFSVPFLGYLLDFAKEPAGFILLVWVPALIIILGEIKKIGKEVKKTRKQKAEKTLLENKLPQAKDYGIPQAEKFVSRSHFSDAVSEGIRAQNKEKKEKKPSVANIAGAERKSESSGAPLIIHPQPFYPEENKEEEKKKTVRLETETGVGLKSDKKKTKTKTVKNKRPSA